MDSRLDSIRNTFQALTGISGRHNRALREVRDWAAIAQQFLMTYHLYGTSDMGYLLDNIGEAKVELTRICYTARPLVKKAGNIKNVAIPPLMNELVEELESMRRALMNPTLREVKLPDIISRVRVTSEKLQDRLAETELK